MRPLTWIRYQADRVIGGLLLLGGAAAVIFAWAKASTVILATEQIPYVISGGLFGLVLVATGLSLWLSADMRDEWRALRRIENELSALRALREAAAPVKAVTTAPEDPSAAPGRNGTSPGVGARS